MRNGSRGAGASGRSPFGAACETGLSLGYSVAQYFGWRWGKHVRPGRASRFHTVLLLAAFSAVAVLLTTVDPVTVTEYSVVFSAVALPLTYFPILVVANDRDYMGGTVNGRVANTLGSPTWSSSWSPRRPRSR